MEISYPKWLNEDFIEKALKSAGDSSVQVISYKVTNATAAGDNYLSDMYRVSVCVTRGCEAETFSVIVKCSNKSGDVAEVCANDNHRM